MGPLDTESNRNQFRLQRRNLNIISLLLMSYVYLGLKISKINILGNYFSIHNNSHVRNVMVFAFIYFLIRFYQYFRIIDRNDYSMIYLEKLEKILNPLIKRIIKHDAKIEFTHKQPDVIVKSIEYLTHSFDVDVPNTLRIFNFEQTYKGHATVRIEYFSPTSNNTIQVFQTNTSSFAVPKWRLIIPRIRSYKHLWFYTPYFTEYLLPFFLAFLTPIVVWLYRY